jgi:hypothetical protein
MMSSYFLKKYRKFMKKLICMWVNGKEENKKFQIIKGVVRTEKLPFHIADDDPVLVRKELECISSFYGTPWPEEVLRRMMK